jgi:hypothetical protein
MDLQSDEWAAVLTQPLLYLHPSKLTLPTRPALLHTNPFARWGRIVRWAAATVSQYCQD